MLSFNMSVGWGGRWGFQTHPRGGTPPHWFTHSPFFAKVNMRHWRWIPPIAGGGMTGLGYPRKDFLRGVRKREGMGWDGGGEAIF